MKKLLNIAAVVAVVCVGYYLYDKNQKQKKANETVVDPAVAGQIIDKVAAENA